VLGALVLWVCWYGFNISGSRNITQDSYAAPTAARIVVCTTLSAASAGFTACFLDKLLGACPPYNALL
jgi:ammonia channel protein AmtB